jgi:hypothetical protein
MEPVLRQRRKEAGTGTWKDLDKRAKRREEGEDNH